MHLHKNKKFFINFNRENKMRKRIFTLIIFLNLILSGYISSQTISVGSGTATANYPPIHTFYGYTYSQQIYTQSQINTAGSINKISFYYSSGSTLNCNAWVIYMGHTTKTSFSSTSDWIPVSTLTQVFNGTVTFPGSAGWMEIILSSPFVYNNTDNLVIAVDENTPGYSSPAVSWGTFTSGSNTAIYYLSDNTNPNPSSPPTASGLTSTINRIQLDINNTPMSFSSATTVTASTNMVLPGTQNNEIIGLNVVTSGSINPLNLTSITFNTNGTTRAADITSAKVYYTYNTTFSTLNQFGTATVNPNGSFTVTGTKQLLNGNNYFWLAYDVSSNAIVNNVVDGECNSVIIGGITYTPTVQAPSGSRSIQEATHYVDGVLGNDVPENGTINNPWRTIQYAINNVPNPTTATIVIKVAAGTYTLNNNSILIDRNFVNFTLLGSGATTTVIQSTVDPATSTKRVINIGTGETVTIKNVTIEHGRNEIGAGINCSSGSNLNIQNCIIDDNDYPGAQSCYGGIYSSSNTLMENCTISNNLGGYCSGFAISSGTAIITNCTFYNNAASSWCGHIGVGYQAKLIITNCTITKGGIGIYVFSSGFYGVYIKNCLIYNLDPYQKSINGNGYTPITGSNNIIESQDYSYFTNGVNGCFVGTGLNVWGNGQSTPPDLALNNTLNGTTTCCILPGSIANNTGGTGLNNNVTVPTTDQRGFIRSGNPDIGAFELVNTWQGGTSSDFGTASNWLDNSVPTSSSDISISTNALNNCVLDGDRTVGNINNSHSTYKLDLNGYNLTVKGSLYFSNGAQIIASNGTLIFGGSTAQTFSADALQTVNNLTINNSNGVSLNANLIINNILTLTNGLLTLGTSNLTLGSSASIVGTPSATNMIVATDSGQLRKVLTGTGSFTFPVGDNTGTAEYSPITLNFTSGTFSSAYAGVNLVNSKHPNNSSSTDYLNRYWTVNQSGISDFSCEVTAQYLLADVVGTEGNIYTGKYDGSSWTLLNQADAVNHRIGGTVTSFSSFTGGQQSVMPAELYSFNSAVIGRDVKLQWITSKEKNNAGFEIQRTNLTDQNLEYHKVGFVKGLENSNIPTSYSFIDNKLNVGKYKYRLKQIDNNGNFTYHNLNEIVEVGLPTKFALSQNYPNPFNPKTKIDFQIPKDANISLKLYDILGREVMTLINNEYRKSNYYTVDLDASKLASGIYFYRIIADKFIETKKMVVVK